MKTAGELVRYREVSGLPLRERIPAHGALARVILLLHGWTGDENSMWIFASRLPRDAWIIAPRAPFPSSLGGYSWRDESGADIKDSLKARRWPSTDDFRYSAELLLEMLSLDNFPGALLDKVSLVGFSQGGALAFTLALLHPHRVKKLAALSTFMPDGVDAIALPHVLENQQVLVVHGNRDEIVPVVMAHRAAEILQRAGARVNTCENDVGHKVGVECFGILEDFFAE